MLSQVAAGFPSPTIIPPFRFRRATRNASWRQWPVSGCRGRLASKQAGSNLMGRHGRSGPPHHVHGVRNSAQRLNQGLRTLRRLRADPANIEVRRQHFNDGINLDHLSAESIAAPAVDLGDTRPNQAST
jgi:hypothetical protein